MASRLLQQCVGARPDEIFEEFFPDGIAALQYSQESRQIFVATNNGRLCVLSEQGERLRESVHFSQVRKLAVAQTGDAGVAIIGESGLVCFASDLKPIWDARVTGRINAVAMAPYGGPIAFATDSSRIHIVTSERRELSKVECRRPIEYLHFLSTAPQLIAAAEFGELSCYDLKGRQVWSEPQVSNIGGIAVSEGGRRLFLAAFNHGVLVCNDEGDQLGTFAIDGIPSQVCCSAIQRRVAVMTLENRIFWLNFEGSVQWAADLSQDIPQHMAMSALGDNLLIGTQSGCLLSVAWN
ncbi:MAG: hypothetical protein WCK86_11790 [Planctomycetia bacterium]